MEGGIFVDIIRENIKLRIHLKIFFGRWILAILTIYWLLSLIIKKIKSYVKFYYILIRILKLIHLEIIDFSLKNNLDFSVYY